MLNTHPSSRVRPSVPVQDRCRESLDAQPALFENLSSRTQDPALQYVFNDDVPVDWSEEDVVQLHWSLLQELASLSDPSTPLDDKLDTLRWVFTDPERDSKPFSFVNCLKVVGCSVLSPTPFFGSLDAEEIRDWIRCQLPRWLEATLARYPAWMRAAIRRNPAWVERRLARNPQWINEEIKRHMVQRDLFA